MALLAPEKKSIKGLLKWGKQRFSVVIVPGAAGFEFKKQIADITSVPVDRQRVVCKEAWKGTLKNEHIVSPTLKLKSNKTHLVVTLIGTAGGQLKSDDPPTLVKFEEDITLAEAAAMQAEEDAKALSTAEGYIPALQFRPGGNERDDGKVMRYRYNYFVTGLPQRRIESLLRARRERDGVLGGELAMTMGAELGSAFLTTVGVLSNGTLVSGREDGNFQMWRNGKRFRQGSHRPALAIGKPGPIRCLATLKDDNIDSRGVGGFNEGGRSAAFATGGNGSIKLWTNDGECIQTVPGPAPGTDPDMLVAVDATSIAATFKQARAFDPNTFNLVPQNDAQRQRRDAAIQARSSQQLVFESIARTVYVFQWADDGMFLGASELGPWETRVGGGVPPATALKVVHGDLWVGDQGGGLRCWKDHGASGNTRRKEWAAGGFLQIVGTDTCGSIVRIEPLRPSSRSHIVAVSFSVFSQVEFAQSGLGHLPRFRDDTTVVTLPLSAGCVALLNLRTRAPVAIISGHTDTVRVLCSLPDGLLTCGGKNDATLRLWGHDCLGEEEVDETLGGIESHVDSMQISTRVHEPSVKVLSADKSTILKEPGYIFDACVLPDRKPGSTLYGLASARYNVVKICL
jgi:WD40 repeat protein